MSPTPQHPFVKIKSVNPTQAGGNSLPTPSFVRQNKICTFADVEKSPYSKPQRPRAEATVLQLILYILWQKVNQVAHAQ